MSKGSLDGRIEGHFCIKTIRPSHNCEKLEIEIYTDNKILIAIKRKPVQFKKIE